MINEPVAQLPINGADHIATAIAPDADFDIRWTAWVAPGRAPDQRMRRRFAVWASVLAVAAAIASAFLRS